MFVSSPNSYDETLICQVMATASGTFARWLGHKSGALVHQIRALTEDSTESLLSEPSYQVEMQVLSHLNCERYISTVYELLSLWYFVNIQPERTKTESFHFLRNT